MIPHEQRNTFAKALETQMLHHMISMPELKDVPLGAIHFILVEMTSAVFNEFTRMETDQNPLVAKLTVSQVDSLYTLFLEDAPDVLDQVPPHLQDAWSELVNRVYDASQMETPQIVPAVKAFRALTGADLKTAKDMCERFIQRRRMTK